MGERNISVSWYLNHGVRGILLSVSVSILLNTWVNGTFPFPGIFITEAGVFYCFRFHFSEHVGERNFPFLLKTRADVQVGYFRSVLLNTWAIGTFPFPGLLKTRADVQVGYFRSVLLNRGR